MPNKEGKFILKLFYEFFIYYDEIIIFNIYNKIEQ